MRLSFSRIFTQSSTSSPVKADSWSKLISPVHLVPLESSEKVQLGFKAEMREGTFVGVDEGHSVGLRVGDAEG